MSETTWTDERRQEDEISAISSIFDKSEFFYRKGETIKCCFNVFFNVEKESFKVEYQLDDENVSSNYNEVLVEHLPPARLYLNIPPDYPSKSAPDFSLNIYWLPSWRTSFVCQKLDEIWEANEGNEILFLWQEFLKNDLFHFLGISDRLDVSFLYTSPSNSQEYDKSNFVPSSDRRATGRTLLQNPARFLIQYSRDRRRVLFERNFYVCSICLEEHCGRKCAEIQDCRHVYCKSCVGRYLATKIDEGAVARIRCPDLDCTSEMSTDEIKDLCPDLFPKYERLLLTVTLSTMNDVIFCPRAWCQYPALKDGDTLATCSSCGYNFCVYCRKVYHGVAPCAMTSAETLQLIRDYQSGDYNRKKSLEKKYGRKQIQIVVEKHLSTEYLKNNTKACPNCGALISKIDGCNKMICVHCQASFCWLCKTRIDLENAYDHFLNNDNPCYGRLLEGIIEKGLEDIRDEDVLENMLWFNQNGPLL